MRKNIKLRVKNLVNKYQTADPFALAKECKYFICATS